MKLLFKTIAIIFSSLAFLTTPAFAIDVKQETIINAPMTKVWEKIGGWCAMPEWHPAIIKCRQEQKGQQLRRFMDTSDGGNALELLTNRTDNSLSYMIISTTFPVVDYKATLAVSPVGENKTKITWSSTFKAPEGRTDKEIEDIIIDFYKAGFKHIAKILK